MGERPQAIINKQIVATCDILTGIFWTRLGTPTGKADSGTVEEIQRFVTNKKPALLYFSRVPAPLDKIDFSEYERLKGFQQECYRQGLVGSYLTIEEFERKVANDLMRTVQELLRVAPRTVALRPQSSRLPQSTDERKRSAEVTYFLAKVGNTSRLLDEKWKLALETHKIDDGRSAIHVASLGLERELGREFLLAQPELADMLRDIVRESLILRESYGIKNGAYSKDEFIARGNVLCKKLREFVEHARLALEVS